MNRRAQCMPGSVNAVEVCRLWSDHVDALDRHLSANRWALAALTVVLIAYPIAQVVVPGILHEIVSHGSLPDVVRTVLNLM